MSYVRQKCLNMPGKNFGIYWLLIVGYILQKLRDILGKIIRYIGQKLWYILWDIFVKSYGIYLTKSKGYTG